MISWLGLWDTKDLLVARGSPISVVAYTMDTTL